MNLHAIDTAIAELSRDWNQLDMATFMQIRALRNQRRELLKSMRGCCGEPLWVVGLITSHGEIIDRTTRAICPIDGRDCQRSKVNLLVPLFSQLNREEVPCPTN